METGDFAKMRPACRVPTMVACAVIAVLSSEASAHVFVPESFRVGAYPPHEGTGWVAEVYLNLPIRASGDLLRAEAYVLTEIPDFTFQTDWIDFPAGPVATDLDENFSTMGDFSTITSPTSRFRRSWTSPLEVFSCGSAGS